MQPTQQARGVCCIPPPPHGSRRHHHPHRRGRQGVGGCTHRHPVPRGYVLLWALDHDALLGDVEVHVTHLGAGQLHMHYNAVTAGGRRVLVGACVGRVRVGRTSSGLVRVLIETQGRVPRNSVPATQHTNGMHKHTHAAALPPPFPRVLHPLHTLRPQKAHRSTQARRGLSTHAPTPTPVVHPKPAPPRYMSSVRTS
jgi:hypothetical protein